MLCGHAASEQLRYAVLFQRREAPAVGLEKRRGVGDVVGSGAADGGGPAVHRLSIAIRAVPARSRPLLRSAGTRLASNPADSTAV